MKKQMSLFIWAAALFGMNPVFAATNIGPRAASSVDLTNGPATRTRTNVNYKKYETRTSSKTYDVRDGRNLYYTEPAKRSTLYKEYDAGRTGAAAKTSVRTTRTETARRELKRKYYLAHPFFQPLKGKFGSVTDLSYTMNSYDFSNKPIAVDIDGTQYSFFGGDGKWDMKQFAIKEDFSYGITDTIAVLGMLKYDSSDYKFKWDVGADDKMDDNGLNLFGIGAQWRFMDNEKWIATLSGYFQHQKDISNNYILDLKGGYKISSSTIYGVARGWYVDFDGNTYGNGVEGNDENGNAGQLYLAYKTNTSDAFYLEGGVGVFSVLDEDWTLNLEAVLGHYDWHQQASIKGAIGWQPNEWFALNLYAKTAFYDSANDKTLDLYWKGTTDNGIRLDYLTKIGDAKLDNYSETTVGVQAIFYF